MTKMKLRTIIISILTVCALHSGAQTLTATYVELADSADRYIRQERWSDAERVIVKALRHEPANKSNYLLWSNLGTARTEMKDYDGALEAFDIGLASAPSSTILLTNRARVYLAKGERNAAMADLDKALKADSTLQWPRKMRGLLRASGGDFEGALSDFRTYTDRFGKDAAISEAEGDIAASRGNVTEATVRFREAYAIAPDPQLLGKTLLTAHLYGRIEEMEDLITEGVRTYPRDGMMYLMRAMLDKAKYQNSAMEQDLKMAREFGVDPEIYELLTRNAAGTKKH